ncbi:MAG: PLP-dependent aminotransferase family protein [Planctomycetota bacterium]
MSDTQPILAAVLSRRAQWAGREPIATALMARAIAQPELISLAAGFVDPATLPVELTQRALEAVWSDPQHARAALQYGTTLGHAGLRESLLNRMAAADGCTAAEIHARPDDVILTTGSNELLFLVSEVLLDPGDIVITASPSYYVYLGTLATLGARVYGAEIDEEGIVPEAVEDRLRQLEIEGELGRVKAIYVTTYSDNPTGLTLSIERRAALLEIAQRWSKHGRIYVIEDAAYRDLRYFGDDVPSLRSLDRHGHTVIHAGTFSKSFSPGVRVGWGILPRNLIGAVTSSKGNIDFGSPCLNQHLMAAVVELGMWDEHIARLRSNYRAKLAVTLAAAEEHLGSIAGVHWRAPQGGLYLWLDLPPSVDAGLHGPLFDQALVEGVLYIPGECCYPTDGAPVCRNTLRLSFGIPTAADLERGVEALARAIRYVT